MEKIRHRTVQNSDRPQVVTSVTDNGNRKPPTRLPALGAEHGFLSDKSKDPRADIPYSYLHQMLEEDKTRLSRDLHDELGQALTILKMGIAEFMRTDAKDRSSKTKCRDLMQKVDGIIEVVRRFCRDLHPALLEDAGLFPTLEWYFEYFEKQTAIRCRWNREGDDPNIAAEKAIHLFRIVQEALTNVARHADAHEINITTCSSDEEFTISLQDDGKGIAEDEIANSRSIGLMNMKERARLIGGLLTISNAGQHGTLVRFAIPLARCSAAFGTLQNQEVVQTLNNALDEQFRLIATSMKIHEEIRSLKEATSDRMKESGGQLVPKRNVRD